MAAGAAGGGGRGTGADGGCRHTEQAGAKKLDTGGEVGVDGYPARPVVPVGAPPGAHRYRGPACERLPEHLAVHLGSAAQPGVRRQCGAAQRFVSRSRLQSHRQSEVIRATVWELSNVWPTFATWAVMHPPAPAGAALVCQGLPCGRDGMGNRQGPANSGTSERSKEQSRRHAATTSSCRGCVADMGSFMTIGTAGGLAARAQGETLKEKRPKEKREPDHLLHSGAWCRRPSA